MEAQGTVPLSKVLEALTTNVEVFLMLTTGRRGTVKTTITSHCKYLSFMLTLLCY